MRVSRHTPTWVRLPPLQSTHLTPLSPASTGICIEVDSNNAPCLRLYFLLYQPLFRSYCDTICAIAQLYDCTLFLDLILSSYVVSGGHNSANHPSRAQSAKSRPRSRRRRKPCSRHVCMGAPTLCSVDCASLRGGGRKRVFLILGPFQVGGSVGMKGWEAKAYRVAPAWD